MESLVTEKNIDEWDGEDIPKTVGDLAKNLPPPPKIADIEERDEDYLDEKTGKKHRVHVVGIESQCHGPQDCGWSPHILFGPPLSKSYCLICEQVRPTPPPKTRKPVKKEEGPQPVIEPIAESSAERAARNSDRHSKRFLI